MEISYGSSHPIVIEELGMTRESAKFVPKTHLGFGAQDLFVLRTVNTLKTLRKPLKAIFSLLANFGANSLPSFIFHDQCDNPILHNFLPSIVVNRRRALQRLKSAFGKRLYFECFTFVPY